MAIEVSLHGAEIEKGVDGHHYNGHVLDYNIEPNVDGSAVIEVIVSCKLCGRNECIRRTMTDEKRVWTIHAYLVGQFDERCDVDRRELKVAVEEAAQQYIGQAARSHVLRGLRDDIRDRIGVPDAKIEFV